jgi:hypothetical protein
MNRAVAENLGNTRIEQAATRLEQGAASEGRQAEHVAPGCHPKQAWDGRPWIRSSSEGLPLPWR